MEENYLSKTEQGKRLKESRLYIRLTQTEFGDKIGLNKTQVKDRESGLVKISPSEANNIELQHKISATWILTGQGAMLIGAGISDNTSHYGQKGDNITKQYIPTPINHTRTESLLQKTARVIESTTPFAAALTSNIEAFHFGLDLQTELAAARALLAEHSNTIHRLQESIEEMKKSQNNQKEELKSVRSELSCLEGRKTG